ncbi:amidohydrolase [Aspergillus alliaceus]|uniref:amidohydrolase n=1 Tax=Petromyces alliaceus TaxID=209559 RepID=UPI0012A6A59C|nr:amidohydrolase 3 [Aspergillus alliaceus]KAB8227672.1 amidohydrolase 3 [Aspergillus alliaceus]
MPTHADLVIRASIIYTLEDSYPPQRALAVRDGIIHRLSVDRNGLDHLIGPKTTVIDQADGVVLPSFDDTHTHLIYAGLGQFDVPVHTARDLSELLGLIRQRALVTKPGDWISTTTNWQEFNIREQRLPTLKELDEVSRIHPIIVRRGGHNLVLNSCAMQRAGITADTQVPPGGKIGKDEHGQLNGLLQDSAVILIDGAQPSPNKDKLIAGLDGASASYAARGIGCVRDCCVSLEDLAALKATHDTGKLHVRVRALITAIGFSDVSRVVQLLTEMEKWRFLQHDPWLSVWGVKFMIDGGIEAAATDEMYQKTCDCASQAGYRGRLLWDPEKLVEAMDAVVRRGWKIGTHAYGDRAIRTLLDVYERVLKRHPNLAPGTLVMEHGGLATPALRERAVSLGIPVTIQHPLLHDVAGIQEVYWGPQRVSHVFPVREWLDLGALVSAGSDFPVGAYGAMHSVWGMTTRQTVVGVKGPEHAISVGESIALHTTLAARTLQESDVRGSLKPGRYADMTIWHFDPFKIGDIHELRDVSPLYTIIGGKISHPYV